MQRCKAKSKRSGEQCKNYAIKKYGVCRMHGAYGGPKTRLGLLACKKAPCKHGLYSYEALQELRECRKLIKKNKLMIDHV
jgi:hypothetical protein